MSYEGNWLLIPQVEAYYHEKNVDDVAQNDSHYPYSDNLEVKFEKCEMGRGSWYELRFRYQKKSNLLPPAASSVIAAATQSHWAHSLVWQFIPLYR